MESPGPSIGHGEPSTTTVTLFFPHHTITHQPFYPTLGDNGTTRTVVHSSIPERSRCHGIPNMTRRGIQDWRITHCRHSSHHTFHQPSPPSTHIGPKHRRLPVLDACGLVHPPTPRHILTLPLRRQQIPITLVISNVRRSLPNEIIQWQRNRSAKSYTSGSPVGSSRGCGSKYVHTGPSSPIANKLECLGIVVKGLAILFLF